MPTTAGNPVRAKAPPRGRRLRGVIFSVLMGTTLIIARLARQLGGAFLNVFAVEIAGVHFLYQHNRASNIHAPPVVSLFDSRFVPGWAGQRQTLFR